MYSSPMRIGGLATGMETDMLIKQMMQVHRAPVNKLLQTKSWTEWQQEAYRSMNSKLYAFRNDKLFNFKLEGNLQSRSAVVTGDSAAVSAKATGDAQVSTLSVKVTQLATAASNQSTTSMLKDEITDFDPNESLSSQSGKFKGEVLGTPFTFKINNTEIAVDPNHDSLNAVIAKINKETNVTAFYENGQISFISKQLGKTNGDGSSDIITFADPDGFLANVLKIDLDGGVAAKNALAEINNLTVERTSNQFSINGIDLTLNQVSEQISTVTIDTDVDALVDKIKGFINDYNEVIETLNTAINEKRHRDFRPLLDEERKDMSESEIELWEEKAKSGLLRSDSQLMQVLSEMRISLSASVDTGSDKYVSLASIGITTGAYQENGKLYLSNEDKLREAIMAEPDAIVALFTADGTEDGDRSKVGVAERLYSDVQKTLTQLTEKAGRETGLRDNSLLTKRLDEYEEQINRWNRRLQDIESRYYRQFTAMETAINRYNSQSMFLMQQFGGY